MSPDLRRIATVGVYGASLEAFLAALRDAHVGLVLDVRQRRGVRGHECVERYTLHRVLAVMTVVLVLLTALGVGGSQEGLAK